MGAETWIIAKLEKPQAIEHLESILEAADGVMVARGDLGVEMPPEKVPAIQKHVIRRAGDYRKPVITATQMLESMIENPRPTRAEASDVANAIYDGTDAVMLSAETAAGKYPVEAVKMMAKIVLETEGQDLPPGQRTGPAGHVRLSVAETICESMAHAAEDLDISAIAVFTETGTTARQLSKYRPKSPIFGLSSVERVIHRMTLALGCAPHPLQQAGHRGADGRDRRAPARRGRPCPAAADPGHRRRHPHQIRLDQFSPPARAGRHPLGGRVERAKRRWPILAASGWQDETADPGTAAAGALRPLILPASLWHSIRVHAVALPSKSGLHADNRLRGTSIPVWECRNRTSVENVRATLRGPGSLLFLVKVK